MASTLLKDYTTGVRCWLPHQEHGWIGAEILSQEIQGGKVRLQLAVEDGSELNWEASEDEVVSGSKPLPHLRNPPVLETTEDLTTLSYLNEPAVLHAIRARYTQLSIYTFSGIVLIATNPFCRVDNLYTPEVIQTYSGRHRGELEPHLFSIAEDAYRCMIRDNRNQTIVVSGESGAGKTVSAKYIMRYLATVDDPENPRKAANDDGKIDLSEVEREILATNPIMEAFGNAKTTRNDNSSRFGKYLEMRFNKDLEIIGARIRTFLLERSRLVFHQSTERNYHIFYQLVRGATAEMKEEFGLGSVSDYHYLNQGDGDIAGVDDNAEYKLTCDALETVGIKKHTQRNIFKLLASLLHLGNINIKATRSSVLVASDDAALVKCCELLGLNPSELARWLTKKQITMRSETIISDLDLKSALVIRDSIAKYVYSTLFDWLVASVNQKLLDDGSQQSSFIGILDIYGFEHFKINSFEQFCINYANEKLQQEFNQHVFKLEQEEYEKEEIDWTYIDFSDNQPCIDLIENKMGILGLLDEESRLPAGTDEGFVQKLYNAFDKPSEKYFKKSRFGNSAFVLKHYAMDVSYETEGFLDKNRDTVPDQIVELLNNTSSTFLKEVLDRAAAVAEATQASAADSRTSKASSRGPVKPRKPTLGNIFKSSLIELMATINSTNAHYIRCIKPNEEKAAWTFDGPMVLAQLRACGVLETIRISSAGFPSRWPYAEFAERYEMILHSHERTSPDASAICKLVLDMVFNKPGRKYQFGKTMVFLRAGMLATLERLRTERINSAAITIQRHLRMVYYRNRYNEALSSHRAAQALFKGYLARKMVRGWQETDAAVAIQSYLRGHKERTRYRTALKSFISVQAIARGALLRQNIVETHRRNAAILLQSSIRSHLAQKRFKRNKHLVELIQSMIRRKSAGLELQRLREERRSVKHFEEAQYQMENKVISLQNSLSQFKAEKQSLSEQLKQLTEEKLQLQASMASAAAISVKELADKDSKISELSQLLKEVQAKYKISCQDLDSSNHLVEQLKGQHESDVEAAKLLNEQIVVLGNELEEARKSLQNTEAILSAVPRQMVMSGRLQHQQAERVNYITEGADSNINQHLYNETFGDDQELNRQIEKLLLEPGGAREELITKLIRNLQVPVPKAKHDLSRRDVLFPANMANLIVSEMWRLGYITESESLIGSIVRAIQDTVQKASSERIVVVAPFWLSNVHDIYSFYCLAEVNILQNTALHQEMTQQELAQYQRLMTLAKHDAESVTFNIYHLWMREIKRTVDKMIVPALVDEQNIPGFKVTEQPKFLKRYFQANGPQYKMDDLLLLLTKVHTAMSAFYLEKRYIRQPILELLTMIGAKSFNDMVMRKNFLSWRRCIQINYNITRIVEWCKGHDVPEGGLPLDKVLQSAKLLQLKKNLETDVTIIHDICWALSAAQIQRIVLNYQLSEYEPAISPKVLEYLAQRVKEDRNGSTQLLIDVRPVSDSGAFELAEPRILQKIEPYIPDDYDVPKLRLLAELTTQVSRLNETERYENGEEDLELEISGGNTRDAPMK